MFWRKVLGFDDRLVVRKVYSQNDSQVNNWEGGSHNGTADGSKMGSSDVFLYLKKHDPGYREQEKHGDRLESH